MIYYVLDLYPSDDPRDGARLRRFTQLQSARYIDPANGVGHLEFTLRGNSVDAGFLDPEGHQYVRVRQINDAVVDAGTLSGFDEVVVGGAILGGEGDFNALTENSNKLLKITGYTLLGYLANEHMWSHTYIHGVFTGQDPLGGVYNLWNQSTIFANGDFKGAMLWRTIYEGQHFREAATYTHRHSDGLEYTDSHGDDKLESAIEWLVPTFTAFLDSDGNAWTERAGEFKAQVGETLLSVVGRLMEAGLYIRIDPDTWEIHAWQKDDHGRDRTGVAWGANVIRFQKPTTEDTASGNILDDAVRGISPKKRATQVLAGDGETYGTATQAGPVPLHRYYPSDVSNVDALDDISETQLEAMSDAGDVARVHFRTGASPATGSYRPFIDILHNDLSTLHNDTGQWDWDEAALPVAALELVKTKTKQWDAYAHLGSVYVSLAERGFQDALRQIIRQPGSHTHPPKPPICPLANYAISGTLEGGAGSVFPHASSGAERVEYGYVTSDGTHVVLFDTDISVAPFTANVIVPVVRWFERVTAGTGAGTHYSDEPAWCIVTGNIQAWDWTGPNDDYNDLIVTVVETGVFPQDTVAQGDEARGTMTCVLPGDHKHAHGYLSDDGLHYHDTSQVENNYPVTDHGSMGAAETFDAAVHDHEGTQDANLTVTLTGAVNNEAAWMTLVLTQDGTGGHSLTLPASVVNGSDLEAAWDQTAGNVNVLTLFSYDGGTNWYGALMGGAGGSALTIEDEGTPLATAAETLNFVGAGVTATGAGAEKTITIPGGSGFHYEVLMSGASPAEPLGDGSGTDWLYVLVAD